jgi:hypothetical protein
VAEANGRLGSSLSPEMNGITLLVRLGVTWVLSALDSFSVMVIAERKQSNSMKPDFKGTAIYPLVYGRMSDIAWAAGCGKALTSYLY